ncbi:Alpha/beta hydrolase fold-3 [Rhizodiscina lignyota]|uniref:Alpha/beta hydrolase fold-3 n=1 Tax=Rhizodiscina lignyota TaxID=1504668 RepID=A0A9P4IK81_9PEZI|nr:Alpha/beta hydrolase fold-3 [Rhizodiscina lignyota]
MFHGGGFVIGSVNSEDHSCRLLARSLGFIVVNVEYRLAPEYPFPYAPNDAWDAVQWAATHAGSLGADPAKCFIVGGTSAGANLSNVVAHLARDEGLEPPLTGVHLMVPSCCPPEVMPEKYKARCKSMEKNANAPGGLTIAAIKKWRKAYNGDLNSPLYVFFNHPKGHAGLPPHFFQIAGMDIVRDEGLLYEELLREESGVSTKKVVYRGVPHGWWVATPHIEASKKFMKDMEERVRWLKEHPQR